MSDELRSNADIRTTYPLRPPLLPSHAPLLRGVPRHSDVPAGLSAREPGGRGGDCNRGCEHREEQDPRQGHDVRLVEGRGRGAGWDFYLYYCTRYILNVLKFVFSA